MRLAVLSSDEMTPEQVGRTGDPQRSARPGPARGSSWPPARAAWPARSTPWSTPRTSVTRCRNSARPSGFGTGSPPPDPELAILVVAHHWDSGYVRASHAAIGREAGLIEAEIGALRSGDDPGFGDERERVAYATVRALLTRCDLDDQEYAAAVATFGEQALVELSDAGRLLRDAGAAAEDLPGASQRALTVPASPTCQPTLTVPASP